MVTLHVSPCSGSQLSCKNHTLNKPHSLLVSQLALSLLVVILFLLFSSIFVIRQTLSLGCHIHNGTYLMLSLTLTITLTLLTLTVTVRVTLTQPTLLTLILGTIVNMAP